MKTDPIAEWAALGMRNAARDEMDAVTEVRRRHEADAADLEKLRAQLEAETLVSWMRGEEIDHLKGLVGQLADALEPLFNLRHNIEGLYTFYRADDWSKQEAALVAAGRIEHG